MQTTVTFYAMYLWSVQIENMHFSCSEFSLLVFPVHKYCLDINCADEIQQFGCHALFVKTNKRIVFFTVLFTINLRGPWVKSNLVKICGLTKYNQFILKVR